MARSRRRGLAPVALVSGIAATAVAGAFWQVSDWRIEQTADKLSCGLQRTVLPPSGPVLGDALKSELTACQELVKQPVDACPRFAASTVKQCRPFLDADPLKRELDRILVVSAASAPRTSEIGWAVALGLRGSEQLVQYLGKERTDGLSRWAIEQSRAANPVMKLVADATWATLSTGGADCPGKPERAYYVGGGESICLGVAVGLRQFITAAHCLTMTTFSSKPPIRVQCAAKFINVTACESVNSKTDWAECKGDKFWHQKQACREDLARCTLAQDCNEVPVETPMWMPPPPPPPTSLYVMSSSSNNGKPCLKLDASTGEIVWPPDTAAKELLTTTMVGDVTFNEGDSGGPVFSVSGDVRKLIGINIRTTTDTSQTVRVVPLYLYDDFK